MQADLTVNGSANVKFLDPDDDLTTLDHLDVTEQVITIDVDSLKNGKYVDITVNKLRVADFPDDEAGDMRYVQVAVISDSFDSETDRDTSISIRLLHTCQASSALRWLLTMNATAADMS